MALPDFSKFKAPYRFVPEGRVFRLYEKGEKTRTTFKTMVEAKKKVLALNNAWRASPAGRKATPNKKYDRQGHVVRNPLMRRNLAQGNQMPQTIVRRNGMSGEEQIEHLQERIARHKADIKEAEGRLRFLKPLKGQNPAFEEQIIYWQDILAGARLDLRSDERELARLESKRPVLRRNGFFDFFMPKMKFKVVAYNRDGSTREEFAVAENDLPLALDAVGIKERAWPGLVSAAASRPLVDSQGDVFKRLDDAYGWYRVTIETLNEAKRNPRKYAEERSGEGFYKLSSLKRGEFFKRKADARKVYRKGDYDRSDKKFYCDDTDDIGRSIGLKGDTMVYAGFDY